MSCKGENPHDTESIGELDYYPRGHGFPGFYYPYENIPGYLSPVVAIHFRRPKSELTLIFFTNDICVTTANWTNIHIL